MSTIVSLVHVIKDAKNGLIGLYDPETGSYRQVNRKWKLRHLKTDIDKLLDNFFSQSSTNPSKCIQDIIDSTKVSNKIVSADIQHVPNKIELEAQEIDGDIILNVFVKGGIVTDVVSDSDVVIKGAVVNDLKLNYNLIIDGARVGKVTNSNVTLEGAQLSSGN